MSFKPKPPRPMPKELAGLGVKLLRQDSPYRLVGEQLYEQYDEADYVDLYHAEGKAAISPVLLAFVTAFQYMENLSDREAAEAVRMRLDWKYALHLRLEYAGFNFSVLSEFRDRVIRHQAEARLFEQLLEQLGGLGLIKRRGRQRTDSLAVLTKVRNLNRLELVVETLRLAVRALLAADPSWTRAIVPPTWEERYGERCIAARLSKEDRKTLASEVGQDGQWLLGRLQATTSSAVLRELPEVQVLSTVWDQQFEVLEGKVVFQAPGPYDGTTRIQTPHDPEARYSKKGKRSSWVGDKLQATDTDDEGYPHLLTDIAMTSSVETDAVALEGIQTRLEARDLLPGEQLSDAAYISGSNLARSQKLGIDLIGPVPKVQSPQARMPDGITQDQFRVDQETNIAICPADQISNHGIQLGRGGTQFRFQKAVCQTCPFRSRCCSGKSGRTITISPHRHLLQAARARQETEDFKVLYRHRGGVEGCLSAIVRGHGIRKKRYIGQAKGHLQAMFTGVAVNLRRSARWLAGQRPQVRRKGLGLALETSAAT